MPGSSPHARLRVKLGEAIRDLMLRDDPENTARVLGAFLEPLRDAAQLPDLDANRARRTLLGLVEPTSTERAMGPASGGIHLRVLRLTREDKTALRTALWELYGYLQREGNL